MRSGHTTVQRRGRIGRAAIALLAAVIFAAAFHTSVAAEQLITLRYGAAFSIMRSIYSLPVMVARDQGFFKKEGLDLKIIVPFPGGSDKMIDALYDDTVDITHVATPFLIRASRNGSDAVAIATEFANPIYSLVARPEITDFAGLKGKTLGFADEEGSITVSMLRLLAMKGLKTGDYTVKIVPGTPARMACLTKGECDAVPLGQPQDLVAQSQGYHILGLSTEAMPDLLYTVTAVSKAWAQKHTDAVQKYVNALGASFRFIRDPENRDAVVKTIVATTKVTPEIARQTMALYLDPDRGVLPKQGEIRLSGLTNVITMMGNAGLIKGPLPNAQQFVDLRYLKAAGVQ